MFNTVQDIVMFFKHKGIEAFVVDYTTATTSNITLRGGIDEIVRLSLSAHSPVYVMPHSSGSDCDFIDIKSIVMYETGRKIVTQQEHSAFTSPISHGKEAPYCVVDERQLDSFYSSLPEPLRRKITEVNRNAQEDPGVSGIIHVVKVCVPVNGSWVTQKIQMWRNVYKELRQPYVDEILEALEKHDFLLSPVTVKAVMRYQLRVLGIKAN